MRMAATICAGISKNMPGLNDVDDPLQLCGNANQRLRWQIWKFT
jgi:hypothetical protein